MFHGFTKLNIISSCKKNYQEKGTHKLAASDHVLNMTSGSFTVDMDHFSNKDLTLSSRTNLERSLSRKGSQIGAEKKMNSNCLVNDDDRDAITSPKDSVMTGTMPEKLMLVNHAADRINSTQQAHHQITIMTGGITTTATKTVGTPTKSNLYGKRSISFKQSSIITPKRILCFFATLSSMGTILLICLTLSGDKYHEDDHLHLTQYP